MKNLPKKPKTAFVTFSYSAWRSNPKDYLDLIKTVEKDCGLTIRHRWFDSEGEKNPQEVYAQALKTIKETDLLIAESTVSSTGVGQQISFAMLRKKPVIVCLKKSHHDSLTFLKGTASPYLSFVYYDSRSDLKNHLKRTIGMISDTKLEKFNFISTKRAKEILDSESKKRNVSQSELLRRIIDDWISQNNLD